MTETTTGFQENEALILTIENRVKRYFPVFTHSDRDEFLNYDPAKDIHGRGHILWLYGEKGKGEGNPSMAFIYRPTGLVINWYNTPPPDELERIRNVNDSIYGPHDRRWEKGEEDFALEKALIHMNGFPRNDESVYEQLVDWDASEQCFISLKEKLEKRQEEIARHKREKTKTPKPPLETAWNLPSDTQTELAIARIAPHDVYTFFSGAQTATEGVLKQIRSGTSIGKTTVERELHKIGAYETLLRDHQILK